MNTARIVVLSAASGGGIAAYPASGFDSLTPPATLAHASFIQGEPAARGRAKTISNLRYGVQSRTTAQK